MATTAPSAAKHRINPLNQVTLGYKNLANAIIRHAHVVSLQETCSNPRVEESSQPLYKVPDKSSESLRIDEQPAAAEEKVEHVYVKIGPFEVRPGLGQEVPIGRSYQPLPNNSISRLTGYLGRDDYGLYIREVPDMPEAGLRPSRFGIWIKQPPDADYRRLQPGQAERIYPDSDVRIGGNGTEGSTAFRILVF